MITGLCDEDCNNCSLLSNTPSNRMLTFVLNKAYVRFGNDFDILLNELCANLTCCVECRIDDFTHYEDCSIVDFGGII